MANGVLGEVGLHVPRSVARVCSTVTEPALILNLTMEEGTVMGAAKLLEFVT